MSGYWWLWFDNIIIIGSLSITANIHYISVINITIVIIIIVIIIFITIIVNIILLIAIMIVATIVIIISFFRTLGCGRKGPMN